METGATVWLWKNYAVLYAPTMVTASGLLFNGGVDRYFRAHDRATGEVEGADAQSPTSRRRV